MKAISQLISSSIHKAVRLAQEEAVLPNFTIPEISVVRSNKPDHGHYSSPAAMQLQRLCDKNPHEIAEVIASRFPEMEQIGEVVQVGNFINFVLDPLWLQGQVDEILRLGDSYAFSDEFEGKHAQVECVSANPTGPITVGRIRGGIIGDTLARLLRTVGYVVEKEYYFNNAGVQMRKLGQSVQARYRETLKLDYEFPEEGYQGDYIYDLASSLVGEQGDRHAEAGWEFFKDYAEKKLFQWIQASLERIGITFDTYFNENSLYEDGSVEATLARLADLGLVYESLAPEKDEGYQSRADDEDADAAIQGPAIWVKMRQLRSVEVDKALKKSSGEPTYRLPDTAYHINKMERGFDLLVNVLGADHIEEAKDVRAMLAALNYDVARLHVVLHQFVTLTESGEQSRMSTRKGEFVTLDEVIDDVGPDAIRYFMLARSPQSKMDFDLDLARKQSNENPVYYIQNAHVRCASIARKAADEFALDCEGGDVTLLQDPLELALIRKLVELPDVIHHAVTTFEPHKLAFWAHEELAKIFHPTYEAVRALHSDVPEDMARARLKLYAAAQIIFRMVLDLMGMQAPEIM